MFGRGTSTAKKRFSVFPAKGGRGQGSPRLRPFCCCRCSRKGQITDMPEEGWLHDDNALMMGEGFFYSFPVEFLGSVSIEQSMNELPLDSRTTIVR